MRILFLSHRVPYPPNKGEKIRAYHELAHLAERHEVWLACLADRKADLTDLEALKPLCERVACECRPGGVRAHWRLVRALFGGTPLSVAAFRCPRLARTVQAWLASEQFDVVLAFSSSTAQYVWDTGSAAVGADEADSRAAPSSVRRAPRVMDLCDVDSEKFRAYTLRRSAGGVGWPMRRVCALEADRLARYEAEIVQSFDRVVLVSEAEREALLRLVGPEVGGRVLVAPNAVDVDYFTPGDERPWPNTMVFAGTMDYWPNVDAVTWFAGEVLPLVRARLGGAAADGGVRLRIVGARPVRAVRRLARFDGVEVVADVPDIRPYVRSAAVSVAPMRIARGVQNKILEALAMGVPVVTTRAAQEGLGCRPGEDLLVADGAEAFADAVTGLMTNHDLARSLARRGRAFVLSRGSWQATLAPLDAALDEVMRRREPAHE
jgi:sugar transferase (PEP-CTERM/EpsH1 system associated)